MTLEEMRAEILVLQDEWTPDTVSEREIQVNWNTVLALAGVLFATHDESDDDEDADIRRRVAFTLLNAVDPDYIENENSLKAVIKAYAELKENYVWMSS